MRSKRKAVGVLFGAAGLLNVAALALSPAGIAASSGASPWTETEQTKVRLIAATTTVGEAATARLGLHFELKPGWKVYWRSPGAAGFPPAIDWTGSINLAAAEMLWPAPKRFSVLGLDTLGYSDEVVLPIDVKLEESGRPLHVRAKVSYLTCNEICIPYEADLALALDAGPTQISPHTQRIARYAARVPQPTGGGLSIVGAVVVDPGKEQILRVTGQAGEPFTAPDLYVEGPEKFQFGAPVVAFEGGRRVAILELPVFTVGSDRPDLAGQDVVLTMVDGERAIETRIAELPGVAVSETASTMLQILALALLGGLILNLMPCVLPVLSLKLLSVAKHGGGHPREVRVGFLAAAAGILSSFMLLGGVLIGVKSAGLAIGWGIQFQQPVFLISMTVILTLFAANLWGLFEVRLPGGLGDRFGAPGKDTTIGGHFLTGAFATLLATPCSAPFLGTAVGFALSRGPAEIMIVFLALGLGLAVPYLAIAAAPRLATWLPRPGRWMVWLRRVLGLALAGTALWLISILSKQTGATAALAVLSITVVILALLWVGRRLVPPGGIVTASIGGFLAVAALFVPAVLNDAPDTTRASERAALWQPFRLEDIEGHVRKGQVVFVDVTADWCLTCQVNKKLVLDQGQVADALGRKGVVAMVADWTRPDDSIAAYLASFGRYGIPFNAVYGPGAPRGVPLPELLTGEAVVEALTRARAGG